MFFNYLEIYMFLFHAETNAFLHRVTSFNWKSIILGKAGSFSQKQVWACLVKTGNDSSIFQGHETVA